MKAMLLLDELPTWAPTDSSMYQYSVFAVVALPSMVMPVDPVG